MSKTGTALLALFVLPVLAANGDFDKQTGGIELRTADGTLRVQMIADNIARVSFAKSAILFSRGVSAVLPNSTTPKWTLSETPAELVLSTPKLKVRVDRATGRVSFLDAAGQPVVAESAGGHVLESAEVQDEPVYHARQLWQANADESLYGLGQQQKGVVDIKGYDLDLWQHNTNVVVPLLVSSRGYGIFWNNMSFSRFGDLRPFEAVPAANLLDAEGNPGGLSMAPTDGSSPAKTAEPAIDAGENGHPKSTRWLGSILAPTTGDYQFRTTSNGAIKVWLENRLVIDHFRQNWLTDDDQVKLHLEANHRYPVKIEWNTEQGTTMLFKWKTPSPEANQFSLWSEVADGIDYYFVYGPKLDTVVAGYRELTGQAPMMPFWSFGLFQSRQRYETAKESLDVVAEFRKRKIPFDTIVQDWQYWKTDSWGTHVFDPNRFPDPVGWIKSIHDQHAHVMISVWGKFYPGSANFDAMNKAGYLYQPDLKENIKDWIGYPFTFYDAFNAGARQMFWSQVDKNLFQKGIDAWWMDATEPDLTSSPPTLERSRKYIDRTALGTASRVMNGYALYNSEAVYDGQRSEAPNQRVFILTRSGFAGSQRYGSATWSGDITSTWSAMAKQIPAGLGFSLSGVPYWTQDVGGYTMQNKFSARVTKPEDDEEWRELNARWFEFGVFTPLLRVHGELRPREMWNIAPDSHPAYQAELKSDRLRYRLLPYVYTLAGEVTHNAGTILRPLVMDFASDKLARDLPDEYMFGSAFLVAPVTTYKARTRSVYLPKAEGWYDFWSGKSAAPGTRIDAPAPYDEIPVFVKAGAIVPFGPELQYTGEKPEDPLTVYVYAGANGQFTLYEDQGATYDYEKGAYAGIPMRWNEASGTLTIGRRQGSFPEMLKDHEIRLVLVSKEKPVGFSFDATPVKSVHYTGEPVDVKLR
ncbi:MAG TPA: TIM-barrel domain-containing protein [Bryobacteraceae bacterium]|nr:TIM-barrel domain-containing protein [Bryobacteraceae bacterium]